MYFKIYFLYLFFHFFFAKAIFAPTNGAFSRLDQTTMDNLDFDVLLAHHAAQNAFPFSELKKNKKLNTYMPGHKIIVDVRETIKYVNDAEIVASYEAENGWIHSIKNVMPLPG